jgi:NADPH-ferrihemoprotein reductase
LATIDVNKELHLQESDRSCRHIEFKIDSARVRYEAGDHLGIFPKNDSALVDKIEKLLGIDLDVVFKLINLDSMFIRIKP